MYLWLQQIISLIIFKSLIFLPPVKTSHGEKNQEKTKSYVCFSSKFSIGEKKIILKKKIFSPEMFFFTWFPKNVFHERFFTEGKEKMSCKKREVGKKSEDTEFKNKFWQELRFSLGKKILLFFWFFSPREFFFFFCQTEWNNV